MSGFGRDTGVRPTDPHDDMSLEPYNQREIYVAHYGRDAWTRSVELAGRHRARAREEYGLTEHWAASEWLDLCAFFGLQCPLCGRDGPFTPHHRKELWRGGGNTIGNILPLCHPCHTTVHELELSCGSAWMVEQEALIQAMPPGTVVFEHRRGYRFKSHGLPELYVVQKVTPPNRNTETPKRCGFTTPGSCGGLVLQGRRLVHWAQTKVTLDWSRRPSDNLEEYAKFDSNEWFTEQQELAVRFRVGDLVEFPHANGPGQGVIVEVIPPIRSSVPAALGTHPLTGVQEAQVRVQITKGWSAAGTTTLSLQSVNALRSRLPGQPRNARPRGEPLRAEPPTQGGPI